jgi:hypothetical protein
MPTSRRAIASRRISQAPWTRFDRRAPIWCGVQKVHLTSKRSLLSYRLPSVDTMVASPLYLLVRLLIDGISTRRSDRSTLEAELLVLRLRFNFSNAGSNACAGPPAI